MPGIDRPTKLAVARDITVRKEAEQKIRALSHRLLAAQENERVHLSRELHDGTAQYLSTLQMYLNVLDRSAHRFDRAGRKALSGTHALAEACMRQIRTLAHLVHPPILDETGLADALRWYSDGFTQRSGIRTALEIPPELPRLPVEVETTLFRIVQESLTNIYRHASTEKAHIRIMHDPMQISLEVRDEGCGLPPEMQHIAAVNPGRLGIGIVSMQERVRQLQGEFIIDTSSQGTAIRVSIPLREDYREANVISHPRG